MPNLKLHPRCEAAVQKIEAVLAGGGFSDVEISRVFDAAAGHSGGHRDPIFEDALRRLATASPAPPVAQIAAAFGFDRGMVYHRLEKLGLRAMKKRKGEDMPGERWKPVPGTDLTASSLGRIRNAKGWILAFEMVCDRPRVRCKQGMVTVSSAVLAAFRETDLRRPARHLNGDMRDCRLENLRPDRMRHRAEVHGGDQPWTRQQDMRLRQAQTYSEAVRQTGHSERHVKSRMRDLGLTLATNLGAGRRSLAERDLGLVSRAVEALEHAGVSDRDINLGLGITMLTMQARPEVQAAIGTCLISLHEAQIEARDVREAMGWSQTTMSKYLNQLGLADTRLPDGWLTMQGPPDPIPGEEWRPVPGRRAEVSNMGRVTGAAGQLLSTRPHHSGGRQVDLVRTDDGRKALHKVAVLVARAFKPHIPPLQIGYLNGDPDDARAENLVPKGMAERATAERTVRVNRTGNLRAASGEGLRIRRNELWAAADAACPTYIEEDVRDDLISDMVIMVMEGRAATMPDALRMARYAYNDMMSVYRQRSIDAPISGTEGLTMLETLADDVERA